MARGPGEPLSRALLWTATTAYAVALGALSVLEHRAFATGRFDLGNMTQAVWSTAHGRPLDVTDLNGVQIVRLGAHVDPILAAFAPLWRLWPDPSLLLVCQAVAVSLGAPALYALARKHLRSEPAALGFALAYLLYPATQWMTLSEFHPVALATPLLLLAIRALDDDRLALFGVAAVAAALTKEHVALAVAALGVWYAFASGRRRAGAAIAAGGIAWTAIAVAVVVPSFNEGGNSDFYGRYREVGGSPGGIVETTLTDPIAIVRAITEGRDGAFVVELLLPLLALPLLAPLALLPALPELALDLLSATRTQTSIHFHYAATIVPALFAAAVFGTARLVRARPTFLRWTGPAVVVAAAAGNYVLGPAPVWAALPGGSSLQASAWRATEHDRTARRALALIPHDAPVSASNSLGAHLSERRRIFSFPVLREAEWVAVDATAPSYRDKVPAPEEFARSLARVRRNLEWRLVFAEDGISVFRRRTR